MKCVEILSFTLLLGLPALLTGCGSPAGSPSPQAAPAVDASAKPPAVAGSAPADDLKAKEVAGATVGLPNRAVGTAGQASSGTADVPKGLVELSPEDRAAAIRQGVCPVSGEPLGSMGTPKKVTVKGQTVFLCCPGCEEEAKEQAEEVLKKVAGFKGR
jgi:YHS domain-containing protein